MKSALLCGGTHKFIDKFVFFHQTVTTFANRRFIKGLYTIRFDTRIPDEERDRFIGMCTELTWMHAEKWVSLSGKSFVAQAMQKMH